MDLDRIEDLIRRYLAAGVAVVVVLAGPVTGAEDGPDASAPPPAAVDRADGEAEIRDGTPGADATDDAGPGGTGDPAEEPTDDAADQGSGEDDGEAAGGGWGDPGSDDAGPEGAGSADAGAAEGGRGDGGEENGGSDDGVEDDGVEDERGADGGGASGGGAESGRSSGDDATDDERAGEPGDRADDDPTPDSGAPDDPVGEDEDAAGEGPAGGDAAGEDAAGEDAAGEDAAGDGTAGESVAGEDAVGQDASGGDDAGGSSAPGAGGPGDPRGGAADDASADEVVTAAERFGWGPPDRVEQFTTTDLDGWDVYTGPGYQGWGERSPDALAVSDGVLTISGDARGTTGGLCWDGGQRHGRWEARVRAPAADPAHHAVLLLWPDADDHPAGGQVAFLELTDPARRSAEFYLHFGEDGDRVRSEVRVDATRWRTWAVEWTPDGITGYVDGEEWFASTDPATLPPRAMHLCVQLDLVPTGDEEEVRPSRMDVDWVRQYAP